MSRKDPNFAVNGRRSSQRTENLGKSFANGSFQVVCDAPPFIQFQVGPKLISFSIRVIWFWPVTLSLLMNGVKCECGIDPEPKRIILY